MERVTIRELSEAVINELKRLGYASGTIKSYQKLYQKLLRYADEKQIHHHSQGVCHCWLRDSFGIDPTLVVRGNEHKYKRSSYLPVRVCQCLTEWHLHGCLPLKKQGKLAALELPRQFKEAYDSYATYCSEAGYSERGTGNTITVGADFGVKNSIDELMEEVDVAASYGYPRVKFKCKPGWDVDVVRAVRKRHPDLVVHIDCNSCFTLDALPLFVELDQEGLAMIEQPLAYDDLIDHKWLQEQLSTPICLDESITSLDKARNAIAISACKWINIKPGRVGGLTNAIAIHNLAQEHGIGCWVGSMFESAVGQSLALALHTLPNMIYPADILSTAQIFGEDLGSQPIEPLEGGIISAADGPGIGVTPRQHLLERYCVNHWSFVS